LILNKHMKSLSSKTYQCGVTIQGLTTLAGTTYLTGITNTTSWEHVIVGTTAQGQIYTRTYAQFMTDVATGIGLSGYVPTSRTLSINGTTYDLTANRSWTIDTVAYTSRLQHQVKAGVAINKGQAVYVTSADGTNMIVGLASNASEATSSKTMGLLDATVVINGFANVVTEGLLAGLDTSTAGSEGDPVWLGTGGNLIYGLINKPYAPAHLVFIGIVTRKNINNGEIFVKVQNGFELNEIHDVDLKTTVPVNGHILGFDGTLWVNKTIAGWLGYTPANASGTTNYLSKFTGANTLGNSKIVDNGSNIQFLVNSQNANSKFYMSPVHSDGRINLNAVAGTNDYTILRTWHTGNTVGLGNGSTFGSALSTYYDSVLIGTSGALYFMNGTFGPLNVPYRLGITTSSTITYFSTGVENNTTNLESNAFQFTAKAHTFYTGTTTGNQSSPNQYTPLFLSTAGNVVVGSTTDSGYKLDVAGTGRFTGNLTVSTGGSGTNTFNGNVNYLFANQNNVYGLVDLQNAAGQSVFFKVTGTPTAGTGFDYFWISGTTTSSTVGTVRNIFNVSPTYNLTGAFTGIMRGFYYNPTLTSMTGATHRGVEIASGDFVWGNGYSSIYGDSIEGFVQFQSSGNSTKIWIRPSSNQGGFNGNYWGYLENSGYTTTLKSGGYQDLSLAGESIRFKNQHLVEHARFASSTNNFLIGTATDSGYKLDVNGTARINSSLYVTDPAYTGAGRFYQAANATTIISGGPAGENITFGPSNRVFINAGQSRFPGGSVQIAASLTLGSLNATGTNMLLMQGSVTAGSALGRGIGMETSLIAAANNDVLVGLDVNPTFTNGAFTGVTNYGARITSSIGSDGTNLYSGFVTRIQNTKDYDNVNGVLLLVNQNGGVPGYFIRAVNAQGGGQTRFYVDGTGGLYSIGNGTFGGDVVTTKVRWNTDGDGWIGDGGLDGTFMVVTNGTERYRVTPNGNLLIGTTTDSGYKLDVEGNVRLGVGYQLYFNNSNVGIYRDSNTLRLGGFGGVEILSSATNISSQSIRMKVFDTGNVAIGTTIDSGYKFDVNGSARVKGSSLTISASGVSSPPPANYVALNFDDSPNHHENWFAINSKKDIPGFGTNYDRIIFPTMGNDSSTWQFNALGTYSRIQISARNSTSGNYLDLTNSSISFCAPWTVASIDRTNRKLVFGNMSTDVHHLPVYDLVIKGAQPFESNYGYSNGGNVVIYGGTPSTTPVGNYGNVILAHDGTAARGYVGIGTTSPTQLLHVAGNLRLTGAFYDSNNSAGTAGQILKSTATGTDWVSLSEITGVDGTGTANYLAKWSDADTITTSLIYDNGTNITVGTSTGTVYLNSNIGSGAAVDINGQYKFYYAQLQGNGSAYFTTYVTVGATGNLGATLNVKGAGATSSTKSLYIANSDNTRTLSYTDDGKLTLSNGTYTTKWYTGSGYSPTLEFSAQGNITWGNGAIFKFYGTGDTTEYRLENGTFHTTNSQARFYAGGSGYLGFETIGATTAYDAIGAVFTDNNTVSLRFFYKNTASDIEGMRLTSNGNFLVGTTTDSGYKLDVNGTARIQGNLTVSSGNQLRLNDSTNANTATISYSSTGQQGPGVVSAWGGNGVFGWNNSVFNLLHAGTGNDVILLNRSVLSAGTTSGNALWLTGYGSFAPTTGTNSFNAVNIGTTYNATGGTSTIRGIYYNPVLTSMTGVTHRAIETVTGDVLFATTSGSVGIGTTSPAGSLHIQKNNSNFSTEAIKITGTPLSNVTDGTSATEGYGLYLSYNVSGNRQFVFADTVSGAGVRYIGNNLDGFNKITQSRADITIGTETNGAHIGIPVSNTQFSASNLSGTASKIVTEIKGAASQSGNYLNVSSSSGTGDILSILSTGNVGIGTTSPAYKLHVKSDTDVVQVIESTTDVTYTQYYNLSSGTGGSGNGLTIGLNTTSALVWYREAGDLLLGTNNTERVRILAGGNVGIGVTTPLDSLQVKDVISIGSVGNAGILYLRRPSDGAVLGKFYNSGNYTILQESQGAGGILQTGYGTTSLKWSGISGNPRVGIGFDGTLLATAHIQGAGSSSSTTSLLVQNSSGASMLQVRDDNFTVIGPNGLAIDNFNCVLYRTSFNSQSISFHGSRLSFADATGFVFSNDYISTPAASAIFDIQSTTKGFLQPRLTTTQKNAISTPATGLQVYDSTLNKNALYNGSVWQSIATETWVTSQAYVPQARTLTINGTTYDLSANRSWTIATTTPGGSDTQFQYNSSGTLAGASALTYNSATNRVGINQASPGYDLDVNGQVRVQDKLRVGNVNSGNGVVHMSSTTTINPSATTIVWSQNVSVGMCAFIEYYILNNNTTTDQRAGTIMVTWNQSGTPTIAHTETTTPDIGSTTPVVFTSSLVGSDARINAVNASSAPYTIVMNYRYF
jgi:hypothetical protein